MSATVSILALWVAFAGTHIALSSLSLRAKLVQSIGDKGFLGLFSVVALAIFIPLVAVYAHNKHAGSFLWYWGGIPAIRHSVYLGQGLAFSLIVGGNLTPSPASLASRPGSSEVRGVLRITRHPLLMGVGLFGALHLLVARVHTSDLIFFAGLPAFALLGCWHQDRRKLASLGDSFRRFHSETTFLPFARGGFRGLAEARVAVGVAIAAAFLLRYFHPSLFGGSP